MTDIVERLKYAENATHALFNHIFQDAREEIMRLRVKIKAMERQNPVAWAATDETKTVVEALGMNQSRRFDSPLFLAPGAQPAPSVPDDVMRDAKRYRFLRAAKNIPISTEAARDPIVYDAAIDAAMLAAAPDAQP